jgi:16S rRNA (guanine1207-N2)-methyltransferase
VFSAGHLDIGARAMLDHLPTARPGSRVLDLGCGNGVLGLSVARRSSPGSVLFVDESYQAVASARDTAAAWGFGPVGEGPQLEFLAACDLAGVESATVDLVVNNPPFHTHQTRTDDVARAMFADARRVLVPDGRLVVVANRHLGHHETLRRLFASVTVVGSTPKFVVLEATGARASRRRRTPR